MRDEVSSIEEQTGGSGSWEIQLVESGGIDRERGGGPYHVKSAVSLMAISFVTCLEIVPPIARRPSADIVAK